MAVLKNEFDVGLYNKDFEYLFDCNKVEVTLINPDPNAIKEQQGNILGIQTNSYPPIETLVDLSLDSTTNRIKRLEILGYVEEGKVLYIGIALVGTDITNKSRVMLPTGESYRCELMTQGEYEVVNKSFIEFTLVKD